METTNFAPSRLITRVYRRSKRLRQATSTIDKLERKEVTTADSSLSPVSSHSQHHDEIFTRSPSNQSSVRCTTPPSTPRRKRTINSQTSSPSKSPSRIKVDKELGRLFSPNGKLPKAPSSTDLSYRDEDETGFGLEKGSHYELSSSMKSRPRRKLARWMSSESVALQQAPQEQSTSLQQQNGTRIKIEEASHGALPWPIPQQDQISAPKKGYGKEVPVSSSSHDLEVQISADRNKLPARPSLKEFSHRWAELDELNADEAVEVSRSIVALLHVLTRYDKQRQRASTKDITGLRNSGQDHQTKEEFAYYVLDLKPDQSLNVRRSTCVELCKRIMKTDDDSEREGLRARSGTPQVISLIDSDDDTPRPSTSTSTGVFLRYIKHNGLLETLWQQLRLAGAGKGNDEALDLAFVLICAKISACDRSLLQIITMQHDFYPFLVDMLQNRQYPGKATSRPKKIKTLIDLAGDWQTMEGDEEHWISQISLELLASAVDLPTYYQSHVPLDIRTKHRNTSIAQQLWLKIAAERQKIQSFNDRKASAGHNGPDCRDLYLVGQILSDCIDQINEEDLQEASIEDITCLLRYLYSKLFSNDANDSKEREKVLLALCALLRMSVGMVSLTNYDWRAAFIRVDSFLEFVLKTIMHTATITVKESKDKVPKGSREIFTLFLALLTDLINVQLERVRSMILIKSSVKASDEMRGKEGYNIHLLGQLLLQEKSKADVDADAGYSAGSLAILLALLIVANPESHQDACEPTRQEKEQVQIILKMLSNGLQCKDVVSGIDMLISIIEDFSSTVQAATATHHIMIGRLKSTEEIEEDQHFFRYLISSLRIVAETQSSGRI